MKENRTKKVATADTEQATKDKQLLEYKQQVSKLNDECNEEAQKILCLEQELAHVAKSYAAIKGYNAKHKKEIEELKQRLETLVKTGKEGDIMLEDSRSEVNEKNKVISGQQEQIATLSSTVEALKRELKDEKNTCLKYKQLYDNIVKLPWYKRLFVKI